MTPSEHPLRTSHPPRTHYPLALIALHWLTLALLLAAYALIEWHDALPKGSGLRALAKYWHEMMGLAVLVVVLVRLPLRLLLGVPPQLSGPQWQRRAALAMHWLLYLFLLCTPLLGWLYLSAKGTPVPFFGLQLPALIAPDKLLAPDIKEIHETIATAGYWLIGGHAAAALIHHWLLSDATLARMSPKAMRGGERN
ncbi:cytochrome b [Comamonas sp. NLF-1-9]|uniref:cytochrome b n=1 Tax=Comamonas sp. NLF-1-9 TaxID=2853163 RepID=UPI001C4657E9|nr:cytochrome b/b6 domain-containing protein [Comamonas sp. NLF-1-9]QXL84010.1 cytochrome b/b6 domain-containing protein [Comamonas sp. NLF-1-9]